MNSLTQKVLDSLKWKKSPTYCAARLNITEKVYKKIKYDLLKS